MTSSYLQLLLAQAKAEELRRDAARHRDLRPPIPAREPVRASATVTLRFCFPDDEQALARLATLDDAAPPAAPVLLAEVSGELRAALSLADGRVVADPFHHTGELLDLLHARAQQLRGDSRGRLPRWQWLAARVGIARQG